MSASVVLPDPSVPESVFVGDSVLGAAVSSLMASAKLMSSFTGLSRGMVSPYRVGSFVPLRARWHPSSGPAPRRCTFGISLSLEYTSHAAKAAHGGTNHLTRPRSRMNIPNSAGEG